MNTIFMDLWKDESGVTAIEYGLIAGLMSAVLVVALGVFGEQLKELFDAISNKLGDVTSEINEAENN